MLAYFKEKFSLYAFGLAFLFSLVHYKGFDKDGAIYLLQVMNYLQPERFVNDVPFMFGNQDSFSIFSPIIAVFFKVLGLNVGGIVLMLLLLLALGFSIITLVYRWSIIFNTRKWCLPITLVMIALLAGKEYGSGALYIPMIESYLVARFLSEILIIAGLIFIFDKKKYIPLLFFILASFVHPLMGGWSIILWIFFHFPVSRMPMLLFAFFSPLSGCLHIGLLDFYPNDWKPMYLRPHWEEFVVYSGLSFFWLAMYRLFDNLVLAKFSISLFWISLVCFYLQFAGSYMEHLLLYQAQPFRGLWLCTVPVIPILSMYVHDCLKNRCCLRLCDYGGIVLGLFSIAGSFGLDKCAVLWTLWFVLLVVCMIVIFTPIGKLGDVCIQPLLTKGLFSLGLIFLLANATLNNYIKLAIEQGLGNAGQAVSWLNVQSFLSVVEIFLLLSLSLVCLNQKKYGCAFLFAFSFCAGCLKILPVAALILYFIPNLNTIVKNGLISFSVTFSFFEILNSLCKFSSLDNFPLEDSPLASFGLFLILSMAFYLFLSLKEKQHTQKTVIPLLVLIVSLAAWDIYKWDSRSDIVAINEKQMEEFFSEPIFPQIKNRGKILFTVDFEVPTQSRINFLTGAYADESIYVGDIFFKKQYEESNRRRNALLTGSLQMGDLTDFDTKIMHVYLNSDTLLSRVRFLCDMEEIAFFVSDYAQMPLAKLDSNYLTKKNKYVYLYGCGK